MARLARADVVDPAEVAAFHLVNRCVRRCYLCGDDPLTGRNYEHRKAWLEERLKLLAGVLGVDVLAFAVMSNHFHVVARTRPDVVALWSDAEVAARWLRLCPVRRLADGEPAEPNEAELASIVAVPTRLAEIRHRLSSVSWLMRFIAEPLARRANQEDQASGRFWQGRFRAVKLCDEAAVLACAAYVDLNPIRAGTADSPENSDFTSVQRRIESTHSTDESPPSEPERPDAWLAPLALDESSQGMPIAHSRTGKRASDQGFLPMTLEEYVSLLDWTAAHVRPSASSQVSIAPPVLGQLGISAASWLALATQFGRLFQRVAGRPQSLARLKTRRRFRCRAAGLLAAA